MKFAQGKTNAREILIDLKDFSGGYNSLIDEARMPSKFAVQSKNLMMGQDAIWETRWGTSYYGTDFGANPDGACEYV